jgi:hypothetical protein
MDWIYLGNEQALLKKGHEIPNSKSNCIQQTSLDAICTPTSQDITYVSCNPIIH